MRFIFAVLMAAATAQIAAQPPPARQVWIMQNSGTMAGLRGVDSVDSVVAWASGTGGTILRTTDGGAHWTRCATPDADKDGATLDFRGIQAWDAQTAIVMASGPGEKSRLYKTSDGCRIWHVLFKDPDVPKGFFDSFWFEQAKRKGMLLGDPIGGRFVILTTEDGGMTWKRDRSRALKLRGKSLSAFAGSNSSIARDRRPSIDTRGPGEDYFEGFVTGGRDGSFLVERWEGPSHPKARFGRGFPGRPPPTWNWRRIPLAGGGESTGAFALSFRYTGSPCEDCGFGKYWIPIAVGGDYKKPDATVGTAAWSDDGGWTWTASTTPPHGYRSAVQFSESLHAWITVGTNGSDISRDDGRTWQPLDNGNWNALSLPFVIGPNGRIARLNPQSAVLKAP
jgi:photosystem II stability/assembly factor-like uncharacterized protein